mmetsp:Transcript_83634/g.249535  ORF Transcript_83634/g.249535 Transcript_83634/m.249535 type:complete len:213 (+) Transcript_83634:95-733(+)
MAEDVAWPWPWAEDGRRQPPYAEVPDADAFRVRRSATPDPSPGHRPHLTPRPATPSCTPRRRQTDAVVVRRSERPLSAPAGACLSARRARAAGWHPTRHYYPEPRMPLEYDERLVRAPWGTSPVHHLKQTTHQREFIRRDIPEETYSYPEARFTPYASHHPLELRLHSTYQERFQDHKHLSPKALGVFRGKKLSIDAREATIPWVGGGHGGR